MWQHPKKALLGIVQSNLSARQASWSQRVSAVQRHSSWGRSLSKTRARSTAAFTVAFWRTTTRQRCRSSQRPTHQATAVMPRETGRKRTLITLSLVGLQSPDLAPKDYSIWQAAVSAPPAERSSSKVALEASIARTFAVVAASDASDKAVSAFKNRLHQCLDADGGHFEA